MAIAYEFIWLCKDVVGIKVSLYVLCGNEEYEISESQLQSRNDKWNKVKEQILWAMQIELWLMTLNKF